MNKLKYLIKKIRKKENASSEDLLNYLRKKGAQIGEDVLVYDPQNTVIDKTNPWLLTIGDHVRITSGVTILTHDYAWSVLKRCTGGIMGAQSPVTIGSNVFIGMKAIITRGVTIGDNVVIGAGSVVTKDCPSNGVYAGNPARQIMSIEAFFQKREARQFAEAKTLAIQYQQRFGKIPPREIFTEYFMLFSNVDEAKNNAAFRKKMELLGNYDACLAYMDEHKPMFPDYETFLKNCLIMSDRLDNP